MAWTLTKGMARRTSPRDERRLTSLYAVTLPPDFRFVAPSTLSRDLRPGFYLRLTDAEAAAMALHGYEIDWDPPSSFDSYPYAEA
jgi:hypothetical protein